MKTKEEACKRWVESLEGSYEMVFDTLSMSYSPREIAEKAFYEGWNAHKKEQEQDEVKK